VLGFIAFDGWRRINRQKAAKTKFVANENLDNYVDDDIIIKNNDYDLSADDDIDEIIPQQVPLTEETPAETTTKSNADYFVLNIIPEQGQVFTGSHLLPTLLTLGLRHGELSIFHRHEQISGNGNILFSLASATEPGIFELDRMESQQFHGLTLFFPVPGPTHPTNALNLMVQTAKRLAHILGGRLCDDKRQYLNENALEKQYQLRLRQVLGKL
jgi:cell division protein ZipA